MRTQCLQVPLPRHLLQEGNESELVPFNICEVDHDWMCKDMQLAEGQLAHKHP